jgi:hypothetical protein
MKLDTFITFSTLSVEDQEFVRKHASPENESSLMKLVPINERERAMRIARKMGFNPRSIYRGPRSGWFASWAPKKTATSLAVYNR